MEVKGSIGDHFKDQTIFITGGNGFIGKVLIEKLLHDCAGVKRIFVLLRSRDNEECMKKFNSMLKSPVFDRVRDDDSLKKLFPISGDVSLKELGISESHKQHLCDTVNYVFHGAASVKFDKAIVDAVLLNTRGTQEVLKLSNQMKHLKAFIHISTAFSNAKPSVVLETVYKNLFDYKAVIEICESSKDKQEIVEVEKLVRKVFPNNYAFTKNLAENVVYDYRKEFPVAIVRPSLVSPAISDPTPGWVDAIHGPIAILIGAGYGLLRTVLGRGTNLSDLLPVDFSVNSTLAAAIATAQEKRDNCPVINITTSGTQPLSWDSLLEKGKVALNDYPFIDAFWKPGGHMEHNKITYFVRFFFLHLIPAMIIDSCLWVTGQKPKLVKLQSKMHSSLLIISYFLLRNWYWENTNLNSLYASMTPEDKVTFNFDATSIDYDNYLKDWFHGTRKWLLKQDDSTIEYAKRRLRRLAFLEKFLKISFWICIAVLISRYMNSDYLTNNLLPCKSCNKFNLPFFSS